MEIAAVIFALAALGGLTAAGIRLSGKPRPPTWMALGHGAVAATALIYLAYIAATSGLPLLGQIALGIFVLAAAGGLAIFSMFHVQDKPLPIPMVIGHGLLAITGFVVLLVAIFG